jgi:ATP-dependent DNA helicase PIF1
LPKGRTLHNRFGLPAPLYSDSSSNIGPGQNQWQELLEADAFIIDEASMIPKHALRIIDDLLRHITQKQNLLFGGKLLIMGGDFRQTLPIQKNATKSQQMDLSIKRWSSWKEVTFFKLTKNMRAREDEQEFAEWILRVGNGEENDEEDCIQIPEQCICKGKLTDEIFSAPIAREDWDEVSNRAILAPLNIEVDSINDEVLEMVPGESKCYKSIDSAKKSDNSDADPNLFPMEFLQSLRPQG